MEEIYVISSENVKKDTHVQIQIKETPLLSSREQSEGLLGPLPKNVLF